MESSAIPATGGAMPPPPPQGITRALTLRQPWAWCIAAGHKDVENRD